LLYGERQLTKGRRRQKWGREKDADPDYIDSWIEYQDHRYDPGYYLGGKIPYFSWEFRPAPVAVLLGGVLIIAAVIARILIGDIEFPTAVFLVLFGGGFGVAFIYGGLMGLKKRENRTNQRRNKDKKGPT
jgi:hypothetical protein